MTLLQRILLLLCMAAGFSSMLPARMLDAIAVIVNNQPITTREIDSVQRRLHVPRKKAVDLLIQDRLQKEAMKDIVVSDADVDEEIKNIAKLNHLSVAKLRQILKAQGTSWQTYRKSVKTMIKQRRFFQQKVAQTIPRPSDAELKRYYDAHKEAFVMPASIRVVEYSAATEEALKKGKAKKRTKTLKTSDISPALLETLLRTPKGEKTAPINAGDRYIVYKVLAKKGRVTMPFETARDTVAAHWMGAQRERALKDYFKKMRTQAHIRYLRD